MSIDREQLARVPSPPIDWQTRAEKAEAALQAARQCVNLIAFPKHRGACHYWGQCICGAAKQDAVINSARVAVGLEEKQ